MSSNNRWIALIPLSQTTLTKSDALLAELSRMQPDALQPTLASQTDNAINLSWKSASEEATANITLVDKPIPWSQLEGPCATAWYWPEAESVLRPHESHLFITLLDESGKSLHQAMRLTKLLVAICAASPAIGIVWGATGAVHEPSAFSQLAATTAPDNLPLNLWIDFRAYEQDRPGQFGLFTTGLNALGHREFEVPRFSGDPQFLIGGVYNITHYLLEKGAMLKDSEVIGLPDEREVSIHEDRSMIDPSQDIWRLEFKQN